jgi:hypothetical protein
MVSIVNYIVNHYIVGFFTKYRIVPLRQPWPGAGMGRKWEKMLPLVCAIAGRRC